MQLGKCQGYTMCHQQVLTIAPASLDHSNDEAAKCLQELHFCLERYES